MTDPNHAHEIHSVPRDPDGTLTFQFPDGTEARVTWIEAFHLGALLSAAAVATAQDIGVPPQRIREVGDAAMDAAGRDVFGKDTW